jgi:hypothetical protein
MDLFEWLTVLLYAATVIVAVVALILEQRRHRGGKNG